MAKSKREPDSPFLGRWWITSMSAWDNDYLDEQKPAHSTFEAKGNVEFHFGYVHGIMDCRLTTRDGQPAVEWSWDGNAEVAPAKGRDWAVRKDDERRGMIFFHGTTTPSSLRRASRQKGNDGDPRQPHAEAR